MMMDINDASLTPYEQGYIQGLKHLIAMGAYEVADKTAALFLRHAPEDRRQQRLYALLQLVVLEDAEHRSFNRAPDGTPDRRAPCRGIGLSERQRS
jgi:hypothetical protein